METVLNRALKAEEADAEVARIELAMAIVEARKSFWAYCQLRHPKFYTNDKHFLRQICDTLQSFIEGRLFQDGPQTLEEAEIRKAKGIFPLRKLILNMPPRFGKSRTLVLFSQWILGKDTEKMLITVSYNEVLSGRFSKDVRDAIDESATTPDIVTYHKIFPATVIKRGDASKQLWSLENRHFTYLGTSFNATITGMGANLGIIDDPIKTHEEAFDNNKLDVQYDWYNNTYAQRLEEGAFQIICMTRWAKKDLCGRVLEDEPGKWYVLMFEAMDKDTGRMLHAGTMSKETYFDKKSKMMPNIFMANYHQQPFEVEGALFTNLKTWSVEIIDENFVLKVAGVEVNRVKVKEAEHGFLDVFDDIIAYVDTADEGTDMLCALPAGTWRGQACILDVLYTDAPMEVTEISTADLLYENSVRRCKIESNNGGRGFARAVIKKVYELYKTRAIDIGWFCNTKNKLARIVSNSSFVINNIFLPEGWRLLYPKFYSDMMNWIKEGKNQRDDGPDCITGLWEFMESKGVPLTEEEQVKMINVNRRIGSRT